MYLSNKKQWIERKSVVYLSLDNICDLITLQTEKQTLGLAIKSPDWINLIELSADQLLQAFYERAVRRKMVVSKWGGKRAGAQGSGRVLKYHNQSCKVYNFMPL